MSYKVSKPFSDKDGMTEYFLSKIGSHILQMRNIDLRVKNFFQKIFQFQTGFKQVFHPWAELYQNINITLFCLQIAGIGAKKTKLCNAEPVLQNCLVGA